MSEPPAKRKRHNNKKAIVVSSDDSKDRADPVADFLEPVTDGQRVGALKTEILKLVYPTDDGVRRNRNRLPGPQPFTMTREKLGRAKNIKYWVCEKSDGERFFFYVTQAQSYLVNRKFNFFRIRSPIYSQLFATEGPTLLDTEVLKIMSKDPKAPPTMMVFDAIHVNGESVGEKNLHERLERIGYKIALPYRQQYMDNKHTANTNGTDGGQGKPPLVIKAKKFYQKEYVDNILAKITKLPNGEYRYDDHKRNTHNLNDGLIFTPDNDNYLNTKQPGMLVKWKWRGLNTIDFMVKNPFYDENDISNETLLLYIGGCTQPVRKLTLPMKSPERERFEKEAFKGGGVNKLVVECGYKKEESRWVIKNFRPDKGDANYITTLIATLETIIDDVSEKDLLLACGSGPHAHRR